MDKRIVGIIALIGGIVLIVSVFLDWISVTSIIGGKSYSGLQIAEEMSKKSYDDFTQTMTAYSPYVALAAGAIAAIGAMLAQFRSNVSKGMSILAVIMGIAAVVFVVQALNGLPSVDIYVAKASIGIGVYLALAGATLVAIGGIVGVFSKSK